MPLYTSLLSIPLSSLILVCTFLLGHHPKEFSPLLVVGLRSSKWSQSSWLSIDLFKMVFFVYVAHMLIQILLEYS